MKLTKVVVKQFEQDQKDYGTKTALFNILWLVGSEILKDIGVKGIKTKVGHEKK